MLLTEFNEEEYREMLKKDSYEDGHLEGRLEGRLELLTPYISNLLRQGCSREEIVTNLMKNFLLTSEDANALYEKVDSLLCV